MKNFKGLGRACLTALMVPILGAILAACAGGGQPSTFYMLRSMESPQESLSSNHEQALSILVGPVTLPDYLDRSQMVTIAGKNKMALDEFNRWAESLRNSFYRVLQENLSLLLKTPDVYTYDKSGANDSDVQVTIHVTRFDCAPNGDAVLTVFWSLKGKNEGAPKINRKSVFRTPVPSTDFAAMVEALNKTLSAFSREVASTIGSLQN